MKATPPLFVLLVLLLPLFAGRCWGESGDLVVIEGFVGKAETSNDHFEDSQFIDGAVGYLSNGWLYRAGVSGVETYTLKETGAAEVEIYGAYIQAIKIFNVTWFDIELGAGVYRNTIKAYLVNNAGNSEDRREVGKVNEVNPFASVFAVKDIGPIFSLQAGYKYTHDVGGVNISMLLAGVRFRF
ncbi:hypothetical protein P886_2501 [Alteromonadaceae bacterium 2753L.S.0a.02]|nr:hypothetical protein P886_2501 [Alteromonadaceae bacterium 2753L.S.0a.02]